MFCAMAGGFLKTVSFTRCKIKACPLLIFQVLLISPLPNFVTVQWLLSMPYAFNISSSMRRCFTEMNQQGLHGLLNIIDPLLRVQSFFMPSNGVVQNIKVTRQHADEERAI